MPHPTIPIMNKPRESYNTVLQLDDEESYQSRLDQSHQHTLNKDTVKNNAYTNRGQPILSPSTSFSQISTSHKHHMSTHSPMQPKKRLPRILNVEEQTTLNFDEDKERHEPPRPLTAFGPDFPFAYDDYLAHPVGLGSVPEKMHGTEVAVIGGGLSGIVAAYELMRMGLRPVVYEAHEIGGRLRSVSFADCPDIVADMGAMRFPLSSTALFHYIHACNLQTKPFPNPLTTATPSTVVDLNGAVHYARTLEDLPEVYREVTNMWQDTLVNCANLHDMQAAIRNRDVQAIKKIWNSLVKRLETQSLYYFLCNSPLFKSFQHRELFGQVGFGTGGWDTDFPNSVLEILRVVYTGLDLDHYAIVGGSQQLPMRLWERSPENMVHWPAGSSLRDLHANGQPRPAVTHLHRTGSDSIIVTDADGITRTYPVVVFTAHKWTLLNRIKSDKELLPIDHWIAIERIHYMSSTKLFVLVDRPFWADKDPTTGRDVMSMTLSDRLTRSTYLFDYGPDRPGLMCLSYTWNDDSLKWLPLSAKERLDVMLRCLRQIYPTVDIQRHIIASPVTISWESEHDFIGAFKANLPGQYRYQTRLFSHFKQDLIREQYRGFFIAGDDVSWIAGWAEGAVQTALNAVWGVMHHLGGSTHPDNPGPGDMFEELAPLILEDEHSIDTVQTSTC